MIKFNIDEAIVKYFCLESDCETKKVETTTLYNMVVFCNDQLELKKQAYFIARIDEEVS